MTEFLISIAGFASDDAKASAARIIASSPGFALSETEALDLLGSLPVEFAFDVERGKGEEILRSLQEMGCRMSYRVEAEPEKARPEPQRYLGKKPLESDYNEEQLFIAERALNRMPRILWGLFAWTFVIALQATLLGAYGVAFTCPVLLVLLLLAIFGVSNQGLSGYVLALLSTILATFVSWGLIGGAIFAIYSGQIRVRIAQIGPIAVMNWAFVVSAAVPFVFTLHLVFTLLKKPVRRWFS
ncbi:MAG: hypothetical protein JW941_07840 [Candidatus Coatesbacteria bacterium]|nr:hypothetical protein [Candidatus Coatesbacteria bacterium]